MSVVCVCGRPSRSADRFCAACGRALAGTGGATRESQVIETLRGFVAPQVADLITGEGERPQEERRLVTALFADLSGFTTLAGRLDAEDLLGVVDPVIAGLTRIVSRYDGYVEKFAGDALLALFGAPVAHEDDAARALAVALDMHAELGNLVAHHPEAAGLTLHVGVNTGTVVARTVGSETRTDYAVLGEAVILAQRLESLAPAGETYVGALTRQLAGPGFSYEDLGPLAVKGRSEPVAAARLVGRRADGWSDLGPLVGRDPEIAALRSALDAVRSGASAVVRLEGAAGSGKSRLLGELRLEAQRAGVRLVALQGASHAQSPYRCLAPLVDAALRARFPDAADEDARLERLAEEPTPPASAVLTGVLLGRVGSTEELGARVPDAVRRELDDAAVGWLADLARRGPLVLEVDDVQWCDRASREVLDRFGAEGFAGVLVCVAGRERRGHLEDGDADGPGTALRLGALSHDAVRRLVTAELDLQPDERLVDHLVARGQGNPLMTRETVRQLRDEGLLDDRHGHVRLRAGAVTQHVPATLEALLAARLDALSPVALRLATTIAVIGFSAPLDLVAAVAGLMPDQLARRLAELTAAGVLATDSGSLAVAPADRVRLDSPLVRAVLYARLTARRRQELHARVADTLGEPTDPSEETVALLAEHRFLAGDPAAALPWLRRAAAYARRLFAHDAAAFTLERGVAAARRAAPEQVADLLLELAEVRAEGGELAQAEALYAEARELGDDARSWAGEASVLRREGRYADALALLDRAEAATPTGDRRLLAYEHAWTLSVTGDLTGCLAAAADGLARGDPDDRTAGLLLLQLVRAETLTGALDAARTHGERAVAALQRAGDSVGLCQAFRLLGSLEQTAGDLDAAAATLEQGLAMAQRTGLVEEVGGCQINLGLVHADRGDHRAAEHSYRDAALTFERAGLEAGRAMAYGNRSCELLALGSYAEARALGTEALELAERVGNQLTAADVHQTLALVAEAIGEPAEARREAEAAVTGFTRAGVPAAAADSRALLVRLGDRS